MILGQAARFGAAAALALLMPISTPALAQPRPAVPLPVPQRSYDMLSPWSRMNIAPGNERPTPAAPMRPPSERSRHTCIAVDAIASAQLIGDSAVELIMNDGQHWRMLLAEECPGISFYHGFYYRRGRDGTLCAGRDVIGARSGGECAIASIVEVPTANRRQDDDDRDDDDPEDD